MILREMLEASLQYTAAIRMRRKFVHVSTERIDEFQSIGGNPFYQLLNDLHERKIGTKLILNPQNQRADTYVVAICILDALEDVRVDFPNKGGLLIRKNVFNSLNGEEATHQIWREHVTREK